MSPQGKRRIFAQRLLAIHPCLSLPMPLLACIPPYVSFFSILFWGKSYSDPNSDSSGKKERKGSEDELIVLSGILQALVSQDHGFAVFTESISYSTNRHNQEVILRKMFLKLILHPWNIVLRSRRVCGVLLCQPFWNVDSNLCANTMCSQFRKQVMLLIGRK